MPAASTGSRLIGAASAVTAPFSAAPARRSTEPPARPGLAEALAHHGPALVEVMADAELI